MPRKTKEEKAFEKIAKAPKGPTKKEIKDKLRKLENKAWAKMSIAVRHKAGNRCVRCGSQDRPQVHHVFSRKYKNLKFFTPNLITLCAGCHTWAEYNESLFNMWFLRKFRSSWDAISERVDSQGTGKIFSEAELLEIIDNCDKVLSHSDEIYD